MKGKEAACASEARGLGMRHQQKPRSAVRVAGLLHKMISSNLARPPTSLAGAHCILRIRIHELYSLLLAIRAMRRAP